VKHLSYSYRTNIIEFISDKHCKIKNNNYDSWFSVCAIKEKNSKTLKKNKNVDFRIGKKHTLRLELICNQKNLTFISEVEKLQFL
jgi:hypothetical protein